MNIHSIAVICHNANKALCETQGDNSQKEWSDAEQWQRDSAIKGVEFCLENPDAPASANHESWMKEKIADGWYWGLTKDVERKTHPCMVPYDELPDAQKAKDHLFKAIVASLAPFIEQSETASA